MAASVTMEEVAQLLRQVLAGEVPLRLANPELTWDRTYAGDVEFSAGAWRIVFFNDCNELDYTDSVTAPDGRHAEFDDWCDDERTQCPLNLLTGEEYAALERMVEEAT